MENLENMNNSIETEVSEFEGALESVQEAGASASPENETSVMINEEVLEARERELAKKYRELEQQKLQLEEIKFEVTSQQKELQIQEEFLAKRLEALQDAQSKQDAYRLELQEQSLELQRNQEELAKLKTDAEFEASKIVTQAKVEAEKLKQALQLELNEARTKAAVGLSEWTKAEMDKLMASYSELRDKEEKSLIAMHEQAESALKNEIKELRTRSLDEIKAEIDAKKIALEEELATRQSEADELLISKEAKLAEAKKEVEDAKNEVEELKTSLSDKRLEYETKLDMLDYEKNLVNAQKENLNKLQMHLDEEVRERYKKELASMEEKLASVYETLDQSMAVNKDLVKQMDGYDLIKSMLKGNNPKEILDELSRLSSENQRLLNELADRPGGELESEYKQIKKMYSDLEKKYTDVSENYNMLQSKVVDYNKMELLCDSYKEQISILENHKALSEGKIAELEERINRLHAPEMQAVERAARIQVIESGLEKLAHVENPAFGVGSGQPTNEIEWLNNISRLCKEYGIAFPKRILYAFHTALKINDWSTITVLAGVSGTGKSELPRLYCEMGRMNFYSVSVQPNWDSQESMLGYFNSIDNRFDAQEVLRFLVQCTNKLDQCMSVVLLDEMNLAHVEYYFAEFLSKLELRRGAPKDHEPYVEVKLGADCEPYELKLKRCILWCGTMNQDETTKSLSDKVLDRGLLINFPRPTKLISRKKMENLKKFVDDRLGNTPMLNYKTWRNWIVTDIEASKSSIKGFSGEQLVELKRLKQITEDINKCLGDVGRAIGHRVWQSIEFYIANYPEVIAAKQNCADGELSGDLREAMHIAYEDQLVQKVMPKLRGIDTTGESGKCLQAIRSILNSENFNLDADFDKAMKFGYGQFIWNSAEYVGTEIAGIEIMDNDGQAEDNTDE